MLHAILIISVSSLFYIYEFFLRVMPSVITNELMREFHINASLMSLMTSCFLYSYALMQIPAGILVDKYGPRMVLTYAVILCAIATLLFQSTTSISIAIFSRLVLGAASSVAFIAPLTLASRWFAAKHLSIVAGFVQVLGCLGAIMGGAPIALLNDQIGWRPALLGASCLGFFLALLFWFVIKDYPQNHEDNRVVSLLELFKQVRYIVFNSQNLWIALAAFSSWSAMGAIAELWGVPFLSIFHNTNAADAALMIMFVWLGVAFGSPIAGWLCERLNSNRLPLILLLTLSVISSIVFLYVNEICREILLFNLFLLGFAAGAQPITFSLIAVHNPAKYIGTAFGFNNMAVVCGASMLQPLIGVLIDLVYDGSVTSLGSRVYSLKCYQIALAVVPIATALGLLASIFMIKDSVQRDKDA